eukprot:TRINITY_DN2936_c0_g1_i2.p1 TRINITY_DN2936_c0_g1~~TRINITY_DN2936_c0_g1_i2.p1  ORF type:complete len:182 (-),score=26.97 TRINITY_DN2936_c0_g1_i2:63-608(-)
MVAMCLEAGKWWFGMEGTSSTTTGNQGEIEKSVLESTACPTSHYILSAYAQNVLGVHGQSSYRGQLTTVSFDRSTRNNLFVFANEQTVFTIPYTATSADIGLYNITTPTSNSGVTQLMVGSNIVGNPASASFAGNAARITYTPTSAEIGSIHRIGTAYVNHISISIPFSTSHTHTHTHTLL